MKLSCSSFSSCLCRKPKPICMWILSSKLLQVIYSKWFRKIFLSREKIDLEGRQTFTQDNELTYFQIPKQSISFPSCKINSVPYGVSVAGKDAVCIMYVFSGGDYFGYKTSRTNIVLNTG